MTYVVRGGNLEKKRKGKDIAWPIAASYDMEKRWSSKWPNDWFTNVWSTQVPDNKKTKVYKEYLKSDKYGSKPWEKHWAYSKDGVDYYIDMKKKKKQAPKYDKYIR